MELQRTELWHLQRLGKATASKAADILGTAAARTRYLNELVDARLLGTAPASFSNAAMDWGTSTEAEAKSAYSEATDNEVVETGSIDHPTLMASASPDGLVGEIGGIEIKCPNTSTHRETLKKQEVPKKYLPQIMFQMWIANLEWVDFVSFDPRLPENARLFIKRVERDNAYINDLADKVTKFLEDVDAEVAFVQNYKGGN